MYKVTILLLAGWTQAEAQRPLSAEPPIPGPYHPPSLASILGLTGTAAAATRARVKAQAEDEPFTTDPVLLSKIEPERSQRAINAKWKGTIRSIVVIDKRGNVAKVKVFDGPSGLDMEIQVIRAISQWKFLPATKDGVPIYYQLEVDTRFLLGESQWTEIGNKWK